MKETHDHAVGLGALVDWERPINRSGALRENSVGYPHSQGRELTPSNQPPRTTQRTHTNMNDELDLTFFPHSFDNSSHHGSTTLSLFWGSRRLRFLPRFGSPPSRPSSPTLTGPPSPLPSLPGPHLFGPPPTLPSTSPPFPDFLFVRAHTLPHTIDSGPNMQKSWPKCGSWCWPNAAFVSAFSVALGSLALPSRARGWPFLLGCGNGRFVI